MSDPNNSTPKRHPRVTHSIQPWPGGRWRVDVMLDGYQVRKAYFDDHRAASAGAVEMEEQVIREANLR
jgi:hypothetical protein